MNNLKLQEIANLLTRGCQIKNQDGIPLLTLYTQNIYDMLRRILNKSDIITNELIYETMIDYVKSYISLCITGIQVRYVYDITELNIIFNTIQLYDNWKLIDQPAGIDHIKYETIELFLNKLHNTYRWEGTELHNTFTIAEHSFMVLCMVVLNQNSKYNIDFIKDYIYALLHDMSEMSVGDISRPLLTLLVKYDLKHKYTNLEVLHNRIFISTYSKAAYRFKFEESTHHNSSVKQADTLVNIAEGTLTKRNNNCSDLRCIMFGQDQPSHLEQLKTFYQIINN